MLVNAKKEDSVDPIELQKRCAKELSNIHNQVLCDGYYYVSSQYASTNKHPNALRVKFGKREQEIVNHPDVAFVCAKKLKLGTIRSEHDCQHQTYLRQGQAVDNVSVNGINILQYWI